MVKAIENDPRLAPYVVLKDKIIANDACDTKRRPDLLLSSGDLHVILECDENQHKWDPYNPTCEWGRMDEIIDEFKEGKIVFVRWNPDNYHTKIKGTKRATRKERINLLIKTLFQIFKSPPEDPIAIYYMFYNMDNPVIAKRWKTFFIPTPSDIY